MRHFKILFFVTLICSVNTNIYSEESAKDIIEKRKSLFSANYKTAKRVDILSKDLEFEKASKFMKEVSKNYLELLNLFPENTKEGHGTEALLSIWENKDEFNALMQKASDDMIELTKAINTVKDFQKIQKELMWNNCSSCHNRFRAPH